jgi:hypothetical protein
MQAMSVKKFLRGSAETLEILAKSEAFAPASSSGAIFFCNFSLLKRKVSLVFREKKNSK